MVEPEGVEQREEQTPSLAARVSQVVVRTMKDLYGRGPTHATTFFCDENVFCVISGGMMRDEELPPHDTGRARHQTAHR